MLLSTRLQTAGRSLVGSCCGHWRKYGTDSIIEECKQRGLISQISSPETSLMQSLKSGSKVKLYCGVDPSARSIHLGNLVPMMLLLQFYVNGHDIVNVIGGATGQIGDPSGRTTERANMDDARRSENVQNISTQLERFFRNGKDYYLRKAVTTGSDDSKSNKIGHYSLKNNLEWWKDVKLLDFLAQYGRHIRIQSMLSRDSVTSRLSANVAEEGHPGLGFNEFTYQILQAYDFYHLYSNEGVSIQVGGNDQWGNITAGIDLIHRLSGLPPSKMENNKKVAPYAITVPLLTTSNGVKFGKSSGNAIFIDKRMNTPFDIYQFFYNTTDEDVVRFLKIFTLLPLVEIDTIYSQHIQNPSVRLAQGKLAFEVTDLIHGRAEAQDAEFVSNILFSKQEMSSIIDTLPRGKVAMLLNKAGILHEGKKEWAPMDLLTKVCGFSKQESRRKLEQGSVYLGVQCERIGLQDTSIGTECLVDEDILFLRIGKQKCYTVRLN